MPEGTLDARARADSASSAGPFVHMHDVRLVFVPEDAPELARPMPKQEWAGALKAAGRPLDGEEIGRVTRDVWMEKTRRT